VKTVETFFIIPQVASIAHCSDVNELVREDRSHLGMEMLHLWYISYTLHIIVLRGGTIQHGRSDQLCFYSETVGPDWSSMRTSRTYAKCNQVRTRGADANSEPKTGRSIDRAASTYLEVRDHAGPISSVHTLKQ
jgi:hypothetical protein